MKTYCSMTLEAKKINTIIAKPRSAKDAAFCFGNFGDVESVKIKDPIRRKDRLSSCYSK